LAGGFFNYNEWWIFQLTNTFKKPKGGSLTDEQKKSNSWLSRLRILIEHVNRLIKRFKMFSYRYRNKQKKHLPRVMLVCGLINFDMRF
jgi:hypothetical protein